MKTPTPARPTSTVRNAVCKAAWVPCRLNPYSGEIMQVLGPIPDGGGWPMVETNAAALESGGFTEQELRCGLTPTWHAMTDSR